MQWWKRCAWVVLMGCLPVTAMAWTQDCDPEFDSYQEVLEQARLGNAEAQYWLGEAYFYGVNDLDEPLGEDNVQAKKWYDLAVKQNDACAIHAIGWMYDSGEGMPEDMSQAFVWYERAAKLGLSKSQFNTGVLLRDGEGVEQDLERAQGWFAIAAAQGDTEAQEELANWEATLAALSDDEEDDDDETEDEE